MSLGRGNAALLGQGRLFPPGSLHDDLLTSALTEYRRAVASRYRPLTTETLTELPAGGLLVTPKIDGELWFAVVHESRVCLVAANGRILEGELPLLKELSQGLARVQSGAIIAGELFALGGIGRPRVGDVARALSGGKDGSNLGFMAFDLVKAGSEAGPPDQWEERHSILSDWFGSGKRVQVIPVEKVTDPKGVEAAYTEWVESDKAEGLVVRCADARIFKVKPTFSIDCAVVGYTERAGGEPQARSLLLALMRDDGTFHLVGAVGSLGSDKDRTQLHAILSTNVMPSEYRAVSGSGAMYRFVSPSLIVEVKCTDIQAEDIDGLPITQWVLAQKDGSWVRVASRNGASLLHPVLQRIREDKAAVLPDIRVEQLLDRIEIPECDNSPETRALPASEVVRREAYTKVTKGVTAVRKLLVWATNKSKHNTEFPAFVVHWTDYSPGRKEPLVREVRPAPTLEEATKIGDAMLEKNIKKGWLLQLGETEAQP